ncbi:glycine-rich domain-containing protein-like [Planktomarina temperata]|nr:glycine-rich domain-containing protein-like [Planktomarina temperata]
MPNMQAQIEKLNLDPIVFSLVAKEDGQKWELDRAKKAEKWYKRFLFLVGTYPEKSIVPNKDIDAFWHNHILDTSKYFEDCDVVFGNYLHHYPYFGVKGDDDRAQLESAHDATNVLYKKHFGEAPTEMLTGAAVCTQSCSQCTHCNSSQLKSGNAADPRMELSALIGR